MAYRTEVRNRHSGDLLFVIDSTSKDVNNLTHQLHSLVYAYIAPELHIPSLEIKTCTPQPRLPSLRTHRYTCPRLNKQYDTVNELVSEPRLDWLHPDSISRPVECVRLENGNFGPRRMLTISVYLQTAKRTLLFLMFEIVTYAVPGTEEETNEKRLFLLWLESVLLPKLQLNQSDIRLQCTNTLLPAEWQNKSGMHCVRLPNQERSTFLCLNEFLSHAQDILTDFVASFRLDDDDVYDATKMTTSGVEKNEESQWYHLAYHAMLKHIDSGAPAVDKLAMLHIGVLRTVSTTIDTGDMLSLAVRDAKTHHRRRFDPVPDDTATDDTTPIAFE